MSEELTILFYAVLAAASPVTLIAALVVLGTEDARVNGIAFAAGFILGQAAGLGIPLIVSVIVTDVGDNGNASNWLELGLGLLMLLATSRMRRKPAEPIPDESPGCSAARPSRTRQPRDRPLDRDTARDRGEAAADRDPGRVDDRA